MWARLAIAFLSAIFFAAAIYVERVGRYPPFMPPMLDFLTTFIWPSRTVEDPYVRRAVAAFFLLISLGVLACLWSIVKTKNSHSCGVSQE
jgi:hypothetical protein